MRLQKTLTAIAVSAAIASITACGSSSSSTASSDTDTTPGGTGELTLTNDNIYVLAGGFPGTYIGNGEAEGITPETADDITLNIEPGTLILGNTGEALTITRGATVNVNGTATDPVVMGSRTWFNNWNNANDYTGDGVGENGSGEWAGFALMGFAASNEGDEVEAEGNIGRYGGSDNADSSGSINYVVIRGAGNDIDGNGNELNGYTLFGTGSGTTTSYVQVHRGLDDGIEHFGSSDHIDHFVLTDNQDDSFDWGQGYIGTAQFGLITQQDGAIGDRMIEADNDGDNPEVTPVSRPTLANITMIAGTSLNKDGNAAEGVLMRRGTGFNVYNTIITQDRAKECIEIDGDATFTEVAVGSTGSVTGQSDNGLMINTVLNCQSKDGSDDTDSDGTIFNDADIVTWFDSGDNNVRGGSDFGFDPSAATTVPAAGTVDLQDTNFSLTTAMGGTLATNFVETDYIGAFPQDSADNWTSGWTIGVNGNTTVWEPATGGTLAGATPSGDGSCPDGTTFVETVTLDGAGSGSMDICQLDRRYDSSDF